jgi:hypothetical protein
MCPVVLLLLVLVLLLLQLLLLLLCGKLGAAMGCTSDSWVGRLLLLLLDFNGGCIPSLRAAASTNCSALGGGVRLPPLWCCTCATLTLLRRACCGVCVRQLLRDQLASNIWWQLPDLR